MKKVLFTGATGLLGKYFFNSPQKGFELFGTFNTNLSIKKNNFFPLDISKKNDVFDLITKVNPDFIIHAAALGNVDYCETHRDEAESVNVQGARNVAEAANEAGAMILFSSSNAIFNGENPPYSESAKPSPLDYYGKTKVHGEKIIKESGANYAILRLMTMYGWAPKGGRSNPVNWIIDELKKNNTINVVNDIYNNHLYAGQAVDVIWEIIKREKKNEVYNVGGGESVSRFDLAVMTAKVFNLDPKYINSVTSEYFKNIVPRPKNTTVDTSKIEKDLGVMPLKIIEGLEKMRDEK